MCAGQGRDVIPVLATHPRSADVTAVLLEIDPENVAVARDAVTSAGLRNFEVIQTDASITDAYEPYLPADLVLACGIFGNISDADVQRTAGNLSMLCRPGATIIWTRHRNPPDLTPRLREWFVQNGFLELSFDALENATKSGVGVAQLTGTPKPFQPGFRFFTFVR